MLGVTRLPPWFEQAFSTFEPAFSDSRNADSLKHLVSTLIHGETQWTVSGLSQGISRPDGNAKSRRAYDYFFSGADWSTTDLVQYHAEYVFDQLQVGAGDDVLLHIDDTFVPKTGDATDGVARLYNPVEGETELGNKIVTSCLQVGDVYVPYRARMYLPEDLAPDFDEPFKKKTKIAVEEIVTPLQLPAGAALTVVFDSAYYGDERVATIQNQGHDVVCRLKSNKHVSPQGVVWTQRVDALASTLEYESTTITVRGKERTYDIASKIVEIEGVGSVKIVASETEDTTRHYLSTDLGRSAAEILELVEHRWNIETVHEESNAKFGFKQYQLEGKQAIERYVQLVFLAWTLVTFAERANVAFWDERGGLSVRLDHAKEAYLVETLIEINDRVAPSLPRAERREQLHELVREFSWSSFADSFVAATDTYTLLNKRHSLY
ncbi:IS701 family transposase [Halococcus thailandensis]|uniref:Transposase, IS4 n=1 Tax=Halococcus thailandensis JCM 13552 TaxID=1227457 RepID=M0N266_9EURY|nr:transposase [Halococcus thailandensis]EMA51603.1 transposase, IS4 [Halococcus thailandensis JCM 13552]